MRAKRRRQDAHLAREAAIRALVQDAWGVLAAGADHELLAGFAPKERRSILAAAEVEARRRRNEERLTMLRGRLTAWPASQRALILAEAPELENALTPAQRAARIGEQKWNE